MPISKANAARYPSNWKELRKRVLDRAGNCCEKCGVPNYVYRIVGTSEWSADEDAARIMAAPTARVSRIVLTIAHLEHDELETQDINQLRALCQKCHLTMDAKWHARNARITRHKRKAIGELFA